MCTLFSGARGSFLALSSPGHPGGPLVHWAQVWVSGGHRSACSGRSKSRTLASNRGVAFRGDSAEQDHGKPTCSLPYSMAVKDLYFVAANSSGTPSLCGRRLTALSACGSHGFFSLLAAATESCRTPSLKLSSFLLRDCVAIEVSDFFVGIYV